MTTELSLNADIKAALRASLDAACVLDKHCKIRDLNLAMKALLGVRSLKAIEGSVLCDWIYFPACEGSCKIVRAVTDGESLSWDESPAQIGGEKCRLTLRMVPWFTGNTRQRELGGSFMVVRNTTGELLLHAKYHKLQNILLERDQQIQYLDGRVKALQSTLRKTRYSKA